jgi:hypothetical protein
MQCGTTKASTTCAITTGWDNGWQGPPGMQGPPGPPGPQGVPGPQGSGTVIVGANPPASPPLGQLWFDSVNLTLNIFFSNAWLRLI